MEYLGNSTMVKKGRNKIKLQESFRDEIALRNNLFAFSHSQKTIVKNYHSAEQSVHFVIFSLICHNYSVG